jgi:hypothetical protein
MGMKALMSEVVVAEHGLNLSVLTSRRRTGLWCGFAHASKLLDRAIPEARALGQQVVRGPLPEFPELQSAVWHVRPSMATGRTDPR